MKLRSIPPAGTPIKLSELAAWLFDSITLKDRREELAESIRNKYGVRHCFMMSSGRAAMAILLKILKDSCADENRNEVVLPSYTCYSVPAAADIAGLKIRICDVDRDTLSYDREQLESVDMSRVLCIVSANLYGYPNELEYLEQLSKKSGCYMIDDSAQSMNARHHDRYCGSFGDVGLYSLDKGKNITSLQGGILVCDDDRLAAKISQAIEALPKVGAKMAFTDGIKLIIYSLLLKPWLYWIPDGLPMLGLGRTPYVTDHVYSRYSRSMAALSVRLFRRIDAISRQRRTIATAFNEALSDLPGVSFIQPVDAGTEPVNLRTAVLIHDAEKRDRLIAGLKACGIGATVSYPGSIADLEEIRNFTTIHNNHAVNGRYIARHILTLPNIEYINESDIRNIRRVFQEQLS